MQGGRVKVVSRCRGVEARSLVGRLKVACVWCLGERDAARSFKNYGQMVECVRVDLDRRRTPPVTVPRDIALQAGLFLFLMRAPAQHNTLVDLKESVWRRRMVTKRN